MMPQRRRLPEFVEHNKRVTYDETRGCGIGGWMHNGNGESDGELGARLNGLVFSRLLREAEK